MDTRHRKALCEILKRRKIDWDLYHATPQTFPYLFGFKMIPYINPLFRGDKHWDAIFTARNKQKGYTLHKRTNKPIVPTNVKTDELIQSFITHKLLPNLFKTQRYESFLDTLKQDPKVYELFTQYSDTELLKILN